MSKIIFLMSVLLTMVVSLAGMSAGADNVIIDTFGATPFLYEALSYIPLNSTASFLGAPLRWDAERGQAVITYKGEDLVLTPNSLEALLAGQPVVLPSPPSGCGRSDVCSHVCTQEVLQCPSGLGWGQVGSEDQGPKRLGDSQDE